jgi:hypothetical protein
MAVCENSRILRNWSGVEGPELRIWNWGMGIRNLSLVFGV